jgi:hypothetical protein
MSGRDPPVIATWLLKRFGAGRYSESMVGDLIEQYGQGRSRSWYWKQVVVAILIARASAMQMRPWIAAKTLILRVAIEVPIVLGIITTIDQSRRSQDLREMLSPPFLATISVLLAVFLMALALLRNTRSSKRLHGRGSQLVLLFALTSLGAGTLTWAETTRRQAHRTPTCACQKAETPVAEAQL